MNESLGRVLIWLAALALPFHAFDVPIQPAELLALPLIAWSLVRPVRGAPFRLVALDLGFLCWTGGVLVATGVALARGLPALAMAREAAVAIFLASLYGAIRTLQAVGRQEALRALVVGAVLAGALGCFGVMAGQVGWRTPLAFPTDTPYPYLARAGRATAFTTTPAMLASVEMMAVLLLVSGVVRFERKRQVAAGFVVGTGFALTLSKTLLPLVAGVLVVRALSAGGARRWRLCATATLAAGVAYGAFSHVAILDESAARDSLREGLYMAGDPMFEVTLGERQFVALRTSYFFNKQASIEAIRRSFPLGIGPGRQPSFAAGLKDEGLYPKGRMADAPHSTYTGTLAELGLPGALGLMAFAVTGFRTLRERFAGGRRGTPLDVAAAGMAAAVLIEAIATDVTHFRHYVWLVALFASGVSAGEGALAQRLEGHDADSGREVQRA